MSLFARKNAFLEMRCVIKNWWLMESQLYNMLQLLSLFSGWIIVDLHTFGVLLTFGGTGFTSTWFYIVFPYNRLYIRLYKSSGFSFFLRWRYHQVLKSLDMATIFAHFRAAGTDSRMVWEGAKFDQIPNSWLSDVGILWQHFWLQFGTSKKQVTLSSTIRY